MWTGINPGTNFSHFRSLLPEINSEKGLEVRVSKTGLSLSRMRSRFHMGFFIRLLPALPSRIVPNLCSGRTTHTACRSGVNIKHGLCSQVYYIFFGWAHKISGVKITSIVAISIQLLKACTTTKCFNSFGREKCLFAVCLILTACGFDQP